MKDGYLPKRYGSKELRFCHDGCRVKYEKINDDYLITLKTWPEIEEQIARSDKPRVTWSAIFGRSINELAAEFKAAGVNDPKQVLKLLKDKYPDLNKEMLRRLKIGLNSRYYEGAKQQLILNRGHTHPPVSYGTFPKDKRDTSLLDFE